MPPELSRGVSGPVDAPAVPESTKGKGKGKATPRTPAGPPPAVPPRLASKSAIAAQAKKRNTHLLALHWKVTGAARPLAKEDVKPEKDALLAQTAEVLTAYDGEGATSFQAMARRRRELGLPPRESQLVAAPGPLGDEIVKTVFSDVSTTKELPQAILEVFFKRREAAVKMDGSSAQQLGPNGRQAALIDAKRLQMLGILLRKYLMAHKGESEGEAIQNLKTAVLHCNYEVLPNENLSVLRTVLRQHEQDGSKVTEWVATNGEDSLKSVEHPWHHILVYQLLKVPQIELRLEGMLFETSFEDIWTKCHRDLETFSQAMMLLTGKKELLRRFFVTALRIGQTLNKDCKAPQITRGFQLSSLDKLVQTRSTRSQKHNMLHFTLACLDAKDAEQLFTSEDAVLLTRAKALRSYTVYQDCTELVQGFFGIKEIVDTGNYTSSQGMQTKIQVRRRTMLPSEAPQAEAPIDTNDRFFDQMRAFVEKNTEAVQSIAHACHCAFQSYKELGLFFDDLDSVYPPPKNDQDPKLDLVAVMHQLADGVRSHCLEVEQDNLRTQLAAGIT